MDENRQKSDRPQNKNLTPGGPGRPKGQRNYATIYREALIKLAKSKNMRPDEFENSIQIKALKKAFSGDLGFYKDVMDRLHGKPTQTVVQETTFKNATKLSDLIENDMNDEKPALKKSNTPGGKNVSNSKQKRESSKI